MKLKHLFAILFVLVTVSILGTAGVSVAADKEVKASVPATAAQQPEAKVSVGAAEKAVPVKVNINTAGVADLQKLKGIGSKTAEEIVRYREASGPFQKAEDLKKVKGVGDKKYEGIKDQIAVE